MFDPMQHRLRRIRNRITVGSIREVTEAEPCDSELPVQQAKRLDALPKELERRVVPNLVERNLRERTPFVGSGLKYVAKVVLDLLNGGGGRVTRDDLPLREIKATQVVDAEDVVRVGVRKEDGIDARQPVPERLESEIGGGID